jgi:DNA-binding transcriptional regulator YiaG
MRDKLESGEARAIRERRRLTQAELAAVVGTTDETVSRWETGDRHPRGELALRYARVLARLAGRKVAA